LKTLDIRRIGTSVSLLSAFPSKDVPNHLYMRMSCPERLSRSEVITIRNYLNIFLGETQVDKNLTKDLIEALSKEN